MKNGYEIEKRTAKALLLKRADGNTAWIQARWMRTDGTLTQKGQEALAAAKLPGEKAGVTATAVRCEHAIPFTSKAGKNIVRVLSFDGSEDIVPACAVLDQEDSDKGGYTLWVANWAIKGKSFQYGSKTRFFPSV